MRKRYTLKGGPLDGKTYDVPHTQTHITAPGGRYRLAKTRGHWEPDSMPSLKASGSEETD